MPKSRIQKLISSTGRLSRRQAEKAIQEGRVKLNGSLVQEMGVLADPETDVISLDDQPLKLSEPQTLLLFHKPRRTVTTRNDPQGRRTVMDFIPPELSVYPVGRLDYHSEGLLLLTNIGEIAHRLMHPRFEIQKIYHVEVQGTLTPESRDKLLQGITLEDGDGKFKSLDILESLPTSTRLEIIVTEGRNRFIRRMLSAVGNEVLRLKRVQLGPLKLGALASGKYKSLSETEIRALWEWLHG